MKPQIQSITAREILDSRGNPTLEATVLLSDGSGGRASVPSGASTGRNEAHEKRDEDPNRYGGRGVLSAVQSVEEILAPALIGRFACAQSALDEQILALDDTSDKHRLGANATLAVSLAAARAAARFYGMPLFRYLGGTMARRLPVPMFNILNGGAHADNNVDIQEFMIVPVGASSFREAVQAGSEIYHALAGILRSRGLSAAVGDEGGYAPDLSGDEEAVALLSEAIESAGYSTDDVRISLDAAASEWYSDGIYHLRGQKKAMRREELIEWYRTLAARYPLLSLEDGLDQEDFDGWRTLTDSLGGKLLLVGDDLFVTNESRLRRGIGAGAANTILIKPNQIGTLTETLNVIRTAGENGYRVILSHRSGETEDTFLADLAAAVNAPFLKAGAPCRGERTAKYNRLMMIEEQIGGIYGF